MALSLCTPDDVYLRMGGKRFLAQALSIPGTGEVDTVTLTRAINDASEEVAAYSNVQIDVAALVNGNQTIPHLLVSLTAQLAVFYCWRYGTQARTDPPQAVKDSYDRALDLLGKVARREVSVGAPTTGYPASNQLVTQVDPDPGNNRMTLSGFRGFI